MTQNYFDEKDRKLHDLMEEIRLLPDRMPDAVASFIIRHPNTDFFMRQR